jgi:hypothetical protein
LPFTLTEYVPLPAPLGTITVSVDWPDVEMEPELRLVVQPVGAVVDSVTVPVNPLGAVTVQKKPKQRQYGIIYKPRALLQTNNHSLRETRFRTARFDRGDS